MVSLSVRNRGAALTSARVHDTVTLSASVSTPVTTPTGTSTLRPKTQTPVSTTRCRMPKWSAWRSTWPMVPSSATTVKPVRSCPSAWPLPGGYDQILSLGTLLLPSRVACGSGPGGRRPSRYHSSGYPPPAPACDSAPGLPGRTRAYPRPGPAWTARTRAVHALSTLRAWVSL